MFQLDLSSRTPIYEQIKEQTKLMIIKGLISPGDKVPSVRSLSVSLSVNPNTISRAYTDMCYDGLLYSIPGKGCFVAKNAVEIINNYANENLSSFGDEVEKLKISGVKKEKLIEIIEKIFRGKNND